MDISQHVYISAYESQQLIPDNVLIWINLNDMKNHSISTVTRYFYLGWNSSKTKNPDFYTCYKVLVEIMHLAHAK